MLWWIKWKKYIFIVNADKKLEQREVKLGLRNDSDVEIVGGLNDGEMIAVDNLSRLRHGLEVNIEMKRVVVYEYHQIFHKEAYWHFNDFCSNCCVGHF